MAPSLGALETYFLQEDFQVPRMTGILTIPIFLGVDKNLLVVISLAWGGSSCLLDLGFKQHHLSAITPR